MTFVLVKELFKPEVTVFAVLLLLILGGVIDESEAFSGFSNAGMLTVLFLFIIAGAMQNTGILNQLGLRLLGGPGKPTRKLLRFLFPVAGFSAFFNNTPIVAMLIPAIRYWARKYDHSLSRYLIPLSYAAILGGTCTLIGTSTTLVVHGLLLQNNMRGMSFFEITPIGLPTAIFGVLFIAVIGHRLLPNRKEPSLQLGENVREFVIEMKVEPDYKFIGKNIEEAGLRHLKGLYLFQIEREKRIMAPLAPTERLRQGDRLFFTGLPETIIDLQKTPGLSVLKDPSFDLKNYDSDNLHTFEVVISANSPLVGKNVRESMFRSHYNAVILAIHRSGQRVQQKIGDVVLEAGDTLLLLAQENFSNQWYHSSDFYLVSRTTATPSKPKVYIYFSVAVFVVMILLMALNILPVLVVVGTAALLLIVSNCINHKDAQTSIEWPVLLIIASAFGISKALENSGVAQFLAMEIIDAIGQFGYLGLLFGVYFLTSFYTEIITNNAAAALMFPIALAVAGQANIDSRPFILALAMAASASFATPIGYQTNMMVYGPGGYRFKDFLRIGIAMNIVIGIFVVLLIYYFYH